MAVFIYQILFVILFQIMNKILAYSTLFNYHNKFIFKTDHLVRNLTGINFDKVYHLSSRPLALS